MATKNNTLFPNELSAEQIDRYREIYQTLRAYTEGTVTMAAVKAIPKAEILEARRWVREASLAMLEAELPDFAEEDDESEA